MGKHLCFVDFHVALYKGLFVFVFVVYCIAVYTSKEIKLKLVFLLPMLCMWCVCGVCEREFKKSLLNQFNVLCHFCDTGLDQNPRR